MGTLERLQVENPVMLYLGLGSATVALLVAATVGAMKTRGEQVSTGSESQALAPGAEGGTIGSEEVVDPETGELVSDSGNTSGGSSKGSSNSGSTGTTGSTTGTAPRTGEAKDDLISTAGQTRVGVTDKEIRWGLHAPKTFDGKPLPLADAPLKGLWEIYVPHINQSKINGRAITMFAPPAPAGAGSKPGETSSKADDKYTVEGATTVAAYFFDELKVFFASGTLGVDQVAKVADEASKTKPSPTPYMAAGGSEKPFQSIKMFQVAGSYDTHLIKLAEFLKKEVAKPSCTPGSCLANQSIYGGQTKVGVVELDSRYIEDSVKSFEAAVKQTPTTLQWVGSVKVTKYNPNNPSTDYQSKCLTLTGMGAQIVVPATDPITTANMTVNPHCSQFKWTMSNFAHDLDTALKLMNGKWIGARGLSAGCYYTSWNTHSEVSKCGQLKRAHDIWVSINSEDDWKKDGQGGVVGYQLTHFWLKAMKEVGSDLTRERFLAALNKYNGFDDLVTSPITFLNSPNIAHGIEKFAVYEAATPEAWKMISDGLLSSF